jgi:alpha-tubulin suppressor-like RCC1 family protein
MIGEAKEVVRPRRVNLKGVVKAALGVTHSCLLTKQGRVYCGGVGTSGELGIDLNPTVTGYETIAVAYKAYEENPVEKVCPMVEVEFLGECRAVDIACGECVTAVVTEQRELFTFGKSSYSRLGHTETTPHRILKNIDRVTMGYRHGFAYRQQTQ